MSASLFDGRNAVGTYDSGSIAETLKQARLDRGVTQERLAACTNVTRPQIANIESGRYLPSLASVEEIADALQVNLEYLAGCGWRVIP